MKNWERHQFTKEFYPTSPAIQNISTALVYPGMGLLEGINVNEGRGSDKPFMQFGAPWINAERLLSEIGLKGSAGINIRPTSYIPESSLYPNEACQGLEVTVTDATEFHPVRFGIDIITSLFTVHPNNIQERAYVTNANPTGTAHLDKLLGISNSFELLRSGTSIETNVSETWSEVISPYLLYD